MRVGPVQYAEAYVQAAQAVGEKKAAAGLAELLRHARKEALLPEILSALEAKLARESGEVSLAITTAAPLSENLREALASKARALFPEAKTLRTEYREDPEILGGFRIDGPEARYDATVATSLSQLARRISQ